MTVFSQSFDKPFDFYVFDMPEAGGLFQHTLQYIAAMEDGRIGNPADISELVNAAFVRDVDEYEMTCLFLQSYFREAKNETVQSTVASHFDGTIDNTHSSAILKNYKADLIEGEGESSDRYVYADEDLYTENIFFSRAVQIQSTDSILQTFIPSADWQTLSFSGDDTRISLLGGGPTEALSVSMSQKAYSALPVVDESGGMSYDISAYGVIALNNADKTVLEIQRDADNQFIFTISLYLEDTKTVYSVRYEYNISAKCINYPVLPDLKKHLLYYAFFTYLETA